MFTLRKFWEKFYFWTPKVKKDPRILFYFWGPNVKFLPKLTQSKNENAFLVKSKNRSQDPFLVYSAESPINIFAQTSTNDVHIEPLCTKQLVFVAHPISSAENTLDTPEIP